jgi:ParB family chromosome partitioning protein
MVSKTKSMPELEYVALAKIDPSPLNHRDPAKLTKEAMRETVASVKSHGLLQPVALLEKEDGRYEIIYGERRFVAAGHAGLKEIPAIVKKLDPKTAHLQRLDENLCREDQDPWDKVHSLNDLVKLIGNQKLTAARLAKTEDWLNKELTLLKFPSFEQEIRSGEFTPTHARMVSAYMDVPAIAAQVAKLWKQLANRDRTCQSWGFHVSRLLRDFSEPFNKIWHAAKRKELDVRKVDGEERCFNLELAVSLKPVECDRATPDNPIAPPDEVKKTPERSELDQWKRKAILRSHLNRWIAETLRPAKARTKLFSLLPAIIFAEPHFDHAVYTRSIGMTGEPKQWTIADLLKNSKRKGQGADATTADYLLAIIADDLFALHEAHAVAESLGYDHTRDWGASAECVDEHEKAGIGIKGRKYPPGLAPADLAALVRV